MHYNRVICDIPFSLFNRTFADSCSNDLSIQNHFVTKIILRILGENDVVLQPVIS